MKYETLTSSRARDEPRDLPFVSIRYCPNVLLYYFWYKFFPSVYQLLIKIIHSISNIFFFSSPDSKLPTKPDFFENITEVIS